MNLIEDGYSTVRRDYFVKFVNKGDAGLEIGPSYRPVFPKAMGWNCKTLDHLDKKALVEKYRVELSSFPNLLEAIDEVDYVWEGQKYSDLVDVHFDYVIACHVLEHQEDFLGFFEDVSRILRPNVDNRSGYLFLALPEKRRTFDCTRPLSTIGDIYVASQHKQAFKLKSKIDEIFYMSKVKGQNSWFENYSRMDLSQDDVKHHTGVAYLNFIKAISEPEVSYEDRHRWIFSQESFYCILNLLSSYKIIPFELIEIREGLNEEFYAVLQLRNSHNPEPSISNEKELLDDLVKSSLECTDLDRD